MAMIANPLYIPAELFVANVEAPPRHSTPFGQTPRATRCRRSHGSSSDEAPEPDVDGFMEYDFRAGGPSMCEAPCKTLRMVPEDNPNHELLTGHSEFQLLTTLGDICRDRGIAPKDMFFGGRRPILNPKQEPRLTLMVLADRHAAPQASWIHTARKLYAFLGQQGVRGIAVEIMDPRFERNAFIHPCHPRDTIFPLWKRVADSIFDTVGMTGIFTLGCYRVGHDQRATHCPPTVLMGVDRASTRNWKAVREDIVRILDSHRLSSVAVIIRKDINPLRCSEAEGPMARTEECQKAPDMGAALSPSLMKYGYGTLGAWLEVRLPGTDKYVPFVLICAHCCIPAEETVPGAAVSEIRRWNPEGIKVNEATQRLTVNVPPPSDIIKRIGYVNDRIARIQKNETYRRVGKAIAEGEFVMPNNKTSWTGLDVTLASLKKERSFFQACLKDRSYIFGSVFASSGLREVQSTTKPTEMSVRDWALVQVKSHRAIGVNSIAAPLNTVSFLRLRGFETILPVEDDEVNKVGRATGFTQGKYHKLRACHVTRRVINGNETEFRTWEHVVLSPGDIFLQPGDSGAMAFNMVGHVVGMFFGGSLCGSIAYFTGTSDLLADIKKLTGLDEIRLVGTE